MRDFPLGAMTPPGLEWQVGKTAGSISFVNTAEQFINGTNLNAAQEKFLRERIAEVKAGTTVVTDEVDDHTILRMLNDFSKLTTKP